LQAFDVLKLILCADVVYIYLSCTNPEALACSTTPPTHNATPYSWVSNSVWKAVTRCIDLRSVVAPQIQFRIQTSGCYFRHSNVWDNKSLFSALVNATPYSWAKSYLL